MDRGEIPEGTFRAMLNQAGGLTEEQLVGMLKGTFTEANYRALVASRTREDLLRLTLGRRFRP